MAFVSRNTFARTELHRIIVKNRPNAACSWCGRKDMTLYCYYVETDGGRRHQHAGLFCCKSCHDTYHN